MMKSAEISRKFVYYCSLKIRSTFGGNVQFRFSAIRTDGDYALAYENKLLMCVAYPISRRNGIFFFTQQTFGTLDPQTLSVYCPSG